MTPPPALPNPTDLWQTTLNWQPTEDLQARFESLYQAIVALNQTLNLTRITSPEDFWEKHLWDSLQGVAPWLADSALAEQPQSVVDIGTGGGFPGLPLAMTCPRWAVTLMDATRKKITALQQASADLGLDNVKFLAERAEQVGHQPIYRESFDLALLRAVGPVNTCAEYALPLLNLGGQAILYRGQWSAQEEKSLVAILPGLGGKLRDIRPMTTPMTHSVRHNVVIDKVSRTPDKFPRLPGMPAKSPLA